MFIRNKLFIRLLFASLIGVINLPHNANAFDDGEFSSCQFLGWSDDVPSEAMFDLYEEWEDLGGGGGKEICSINACESNDEGNSYLSSYGGINEITGGVNGSTKICCDASACNCNKQNLQVDLEIVNKKIQMKNELLAYLISYKTYWTEKRLENITQRDKLIADFDPLKGALVSATTIVANVFPWTKCGKAARFAKALKCNPVTQAKICAIVAKRQITKSVADLAKASADKKYIDILLKTGTKGSVTACSGALIEFVAGDGVKSCLELNPAVEKYNSVIDQCSANELRAAGEIRAVRDRLAELNAEKARIEAEIAKACCPKK